MGNLLFLYLFKIWSPLLKAIVFLSVTLILSSLLDDCYHYLVFMDPVNGYSKSKLLVKKQVSLNVLFRAYNFIIKRATTSAIIVEINTKDVKLVKANISSLRSKRHLQSISLFT